MQVEIEPVSGESFVWDFYFRDRTGLICQEHFEGESGKRGLALGGG
jgi:hypothetical protein